MVPMAVQELKPGTSAAWVLSCVLPLTITGVTNPDNLILAEQSMYTA